MPTSSAAPPVSQRRPAPIAGVRRILFVDDDELILRSMERVLRRPAVDIILCDANMAKMNGATLLRRVQERDPSVVRILLSGHTGLDVLRTALPYAHQFLPKPCDGQLLKSTLDSACGVRSLLARPEMR